MSRAAHRLSSLTTPLAPDRQGNPALQLREVRGHESVNRLFEYELLAHSTRDDLGAADLLGQRVHLNLCDQDGKPCELDSVVSQLQACGQERDLFLYRLRLVPWFWLAGRNSDCRCFQDLDTRDIINQVLAAYPFPSRWQISMPLHKREFCVQYNESDFAFVCRLLEDEGISWYFVHDAERHTLVFDDFLSPAHQIPGHNELPFLSSDSRRVHEREALKAAQPRFALKASKHFSGDFNFKRPQHSKWGKYTFPKQHAQAGAEVYRWPGKFQTREHGMQLARNRQEGQQSLHLMITLDSEVRATAFGAAGPCSPSKAIRRPPSTAA